MSDSINSLQNKPLPQGALNSSKAATPPPVKAAAPVVKPAAAAAAAKSASVVALGKPAPALGLYAANGTTAAPVASKTSGTGNADGSYTAGKDAVSITIEKSDSGYDNKIYYSTDNFKTKQLVGVDNNTGTINIGKFAAGTRIDFGIDNGQGDFFRTGGAATNPDKFQYTKTTAAADGGQQVGFEDLRGGGDRDFNDAIITVRSIPDPAKAPEAKDNRSGLGDGTNPGQGGGTANSPNTGTANPSAAKTPVAAVPVPPKPVAVPLPVAAKPANAPAAPAVPAAAPTAAKPPVAAPVVAKPAAVAAPVVAKPVTPPIVVAPKAPVVNTSTVKDNRSGLGDGTNPGNGAGTANSPNTGTLNPSAAKPPVSTAPVAAKPVAAPVTAKPVAAPVTTKPVAAPVTAVKPATTAAPAAVKPAVVTAPKITENRSGLGDATNLGNIQGTVNAPTTGTLNPASSTASSATTTSGVNAAAATTQAKAETAVIDKRVEAALQAYQIPPAQKFTTNVQV